MTRAVRLGTAAGEAQCDQESVMSRLAEARGEASWPKCSDDALISPRSFRHSVGCRTGLLNQFLWTPEGRVSGPSCAILGGPS